MVASAKPAMPARKPRKKKAKEEDKSQQEIKKFFKPEKVKKEKSSPRKSADCLEMTKDSEEESDDDDYKVNEQFLDDLLRLPERPADGGKTMDEILDDMDKEIAEKQRLHEEEMEVLDKDIEEGQRKRLERNERKKRNSKLRNMLETELTEEKLRKMFQDNLQYLQDIWDGKIDSSRHKAFYQSVRTRHALYYTMITDPFTDDQLDWTLDEISKVWMRDRV